MPSLGEAYIEVHASTASFQRELEAQVKKSTNAIEKAQNAPAARRASNPATSQETQDLKAQTARNKLLYKEDQAFKVAAAKAAEEAIKRVNRDTAQQLQNDLDRQVTAEKIAAEAIKRVNRDTAQQLQNDLDRQVTAEKIAAAARKAVADDLKRNNAAGIEELKIKYRDLEVAERAAYAAERELTRQAREADDAHKGLGARLVAVSSALSRIGFTGQTRLITLGLGVGAPVALLGAFALAAAAATAAVTVFGIKSADAARSATLQFRSLGLTMDQAKAQFADLQELSNKGLAIANLDADASRLLQLGISAKDTTKILGELGDIFSANGDVGATLQKDIDDTSKKFATLVNTAKVTPRTFQAAVASLGIGVTAQAAFDQVKKNLNVTTKGLDEIIQKGKLSGTTLAQAALQVAGNGTEGALANAVASSPTQALAALKSSAQSTLATAFENQGTTIAGFINQLSGKLNEFLAEFAPKVIKTLKETLPEIIDAIKPFGNALIDTMQLVGPAFKALGPILTDLSAHITNFFTQLNTKGSQTQQFVHGLAETLAEIGDFFSAIGPGLNSFGHAIAEIVIQIGALRPVLQPVFDLLKAFLSSGIGTFLVTSATLLIALRLAGAGIATLSVKLAQGVIAFREYAAGAFAAKLEVAGVGAAAETAALGVGAANAKMGGSAAALKTRVGGAASGIFISLSLISLAWDQLGLKSKTGEGFVASALDGIQYLSGKAGGAVLGTLGHVANGFGLFSNSVGESLLNAGAASAGFANTIISNMRQVDSNIYDSAGNIIQNLSAIQQQWLETSGALTKGSALQTQLANGSHLVQRGPGLELLSPDQQLARSQAESQAKIDKLFKPFTTGGAAGLDLAGGGGGGAASAAADRIKSAFADLSGDLKAIADKTSEQTKAQIKSEFNALIKDLKDSGNKALVAGAQVVEDKILARIKKLKPLQDKLKAELGIAQTVKDSVIAGGAIDGGQGIATTFTGITNKLRFGASTAQAFLTAIKKLQAEKLNRTSIKQLVDGFASDPAGALAAAQALVGAGQAGITGPGGINELQDTLTDLGNQLGDQTAGELYKQGQHIGDGLIEGLKSKVKEAEKVINDLADKMEKALRKKIKAHSPSEVYDDLAGDMIDGVVGGLDRRAYKVEGAAGRMGQTLINFGPGSVAVNNANPANPAGSGLMVGHGIVGVLERQRTQAVLQGVG